MLPNFILIGAMKSGTSSLHHYLDEHPEISMSYPKELDFFIEERRWSKGFAWYESHFSKTATIRGESSVGYTQRHKYAGVPERIHAMDPDIKLLYLLRDPLERLVSHFTQLSLMGLEQRDFTGVLDELPGSDYVLSSSYYHQLSAYLDFFSREQIQILTLEELVRDKVGTIQKVFRFLGVEEHFVGKDWALVHNRSVDKYERNTLGKVMHKVPFKSRWKPMVPEPIATAYSRLTARKPEERLQPLLSDEKRAEIRTLLREDIARLREVAGRNFLEWNV
jgi:hypothetical protein